VTILGMDDQLSIPRKVGVFCLCSSVQTGSGPIQSRIQSMSGNSAPVNKLQK